MARRLRLAIAGVALHVVQRGMSRHACFFGDGDRFVYLETLRVLAAETGCAVHAYCLMTNHAHLLVTPGTDTACGRMMKQLGQRYVQYVNRRYGRS